MNPETPAAAGARFDDVEDVRDRLRKVDYLSDEGIAGIVYLADRLGKPILVEGPAGTGKTQLAKSVAEITGARLIRLQCYEGLDESKALYEWNYKKQLLRIQATKTDEDRAGWEDIEEDIFSDEFLLTRPLLEAIRAEDPVVLLIDEVDRVEVETEALLLEILSDYQVSIPELGTVVANQIPLVFLTSNNTRELSEALKRRCLYLHIDYPDMEREKEIVLTKVPEITETLADEVSRIVRSIRQLELKKSPSVSETLDWARTLVLLGLEHVDSETAASTANILLKYQTDIAKVVKEFSTEQPAFKRGGGPSRPTSEPAAVSATDSDTSPPRSGPPDGTADRAGAALLDLLNGFIVELREAGLPVSLTENLDAMEAVQHIPIDDRSAFKYALAATLVKNHSHWRAFETVFEVYFSLRGAEFSIDDENPFELDEDESEMTPPEGEGQGQSQGGAGENMTPEELAEMLYKALLRGDQAMTSAVARQSVRRYAGMEPGRPVGGTYYLYRTLRNLDLDGVLERLMQQAHQDAPEPLTPLEERLEHDEYENRIEQLKKEIESEIRRRLVADRGVEAMAKTLRKPLPEDIDFMHASREEMVDAAQGAAAAHPTARGSAGPQASPWPQGCPRLPQHRSPLAQLRRCAGRAEVPVSPARPSPRSSSSPTSPDRSRPSPASRCTSCTPSQASSPGCGRSCSSTASTR